MEENTQSGPTMDQVIAQIDAAKDLPHDEKMAFLKQIETYLNARSEARQAQAPPPVAPPAAASAQAPEGPPPGSVAAVAQQYFEKQGTLAFGGLTKGRPFNGGLRSMAPPQPAPAPVDPRAGMADALQAKAAQRGFGLGDRRETETRGSLNAQFDPSQGPPTFASMRPGSAFEGQHRYMAPLTPATQQGFGFGRKPAPGQRVVDLRGTIGGPR